ncbi:MAG: LptF/LptG family permease [Cyclobacteriaceae bacterium]
MKIIDWYILKKLLSTFIFTILIFVAVIIIIDFTEKNDEFIEHNLSFQQIAAYYIDFFPWIANLITPIMIFIATVFVTSKMAGHTELIAILSSGVSFRRMMIPYLIGSVLVAGVSFYLSGWLIPESDKDRVAFLVAYTKQPFSYTARDVHIKVAPESYLYMRNYNNNSKTGYQFTLETVQGNDVREKLSARRISWQEDSSRWKLYSWNLRTFDGLNETIEQGNELDTVLNLTPKYFESNRFLEQALTIDELNETIADLRNRGADNVQTYVVEKYIRFMTPFAVIILTFIGLIVSARKSRGGTGFQIALGFLIAFIYIIAFMMSREFALKGTMNPLLAVWMPNIIFTIVGLVMYKTVPR